MKHLATILALGLCCSALASPGRALAERRPAEGALNLAAPRAGALTPSPALSPAPAPVATPELSEQQELDRLALTYGRQKAVMGYRMGFALSGVTFLLSMLWVTHPQEQGALNEIDSTVVSGGDLVSVQPDAAVLGMMTWLTVLTTTPAVGRAGRWARLHREIDRDFTLRALGWTCYVTSSVLGLSLNTYGLLEGGQPKAQIAMTGVLGTSALLLLAFDDLRVARRAERIAVRDRVGTGEEPHAWWAPDLSIGSTGRGARVVLGARGAF